VAQGSNASLNSLFQRLRGHIIVSCQASEGDPMDDLDTLTRIAISVLRGGAGGLRAEGTTRIVAFRAITQLPIIGIIKAYDTNGDVYITPDFRSAQAISDAGADIAALPLPNPGQNSSAASTRSFAVQSSPTSPPSKTPSLQSAPEPTQSPPHSTATPPKPQASARLPGLYSSPSWHT